MTVYIDMLGISLCYIYILCQWLMYVSVAYTLAFECVCEYMSGDVTAFVSICVSVYTNMCIS